MGSSTVMSKRKALIDSDSLLYKHAAACQETIKWDDENTTTLVTDIKVAEEALMEELNRILYKVGATEYELVVSTGFIFRYGIYPNYKHNRKKTSDNPLQLVAPLKEFVVDKLRAVLPTFVEADDYCVAKMYAEPDDWILCHIDKDLDQAAGLHYNYNKDTTYTVTQEEADYFFYLQILQGDSVDGYKGCPTIGPVKANKILEECKGLSEEAFWDTVVKTYETKGLTERDALQQARCAYMLRPNEYDCDTDTMLELWQPPHRR